MGLAQLYCKDHPDRAGIGLCVACGATVCDECSTRVDGVIHCKPCLLRTVRQAPASRWRSWSAMGPAILFVPLAYAVLFLCLYGLAFLIAVIPKMQDFVESNFLTP
ncbi:MAG: hypothetical protein HYU36_21805 [Planctomycetes bacterium]|nr:hypothetical protein [Planctomycetota bacterium]